MMAVLNRYLLLSQQLVGQIGGFCTLLNERLMIILFDEVSQFLLPGPHHENGDRDLRDPCTCQGDILETAQKTNETKSCRRSGSYATPRLDSPSMPIQLTSSSSRLASNSSAIKFSNCCCKRLFVSSSSAMAARAFATSDSSSGNRPAFAFRSGIIDSSCFNASRSPS